MPPRMCVRACVSACTRLALQKELVREERVSRVLDIVSLHCIVGCTREHRAETKEGVAKGERNEGRTVETKRTIREIRS